MSTARQNSWWVPIGLVTIGLGVGALATFSSLGLHHKNSATPSYEQSHVTLGEQTVQARIPLTRAASELGLGGVTSLTDAEGMLWLFRPPSRPTFWMKGMNIGLDFIWIAQGRIVAMDTDVPPPTETLELPLYQPAENVDQVLEVAAGFSGRHHLHLGDAVVTASP